MKGNAPLQLTQLGLDPAQFFRATTDEYHGPCPHCGGKDRFRIRTHDPFPHWWWACRQCNKSGWADQLNSQLRTPISEAERAQWARQQLAKEAAKAAETQKRLSEFTSAELWAELHRRMAEEQKQQWREWGIPDSWQNYLELGYTPHYSQSLDTPAYTIPYFHNTTDGRQFQTMQYRLVEAPDPNDRYRFAYGLPATYYEATPTQPIHEIAIICEGAKKAMNMLIWGGVNDSTSVLAAPSKSAWGGVEAAVKNCGRVYVLLDPDGRKEAHALAERIGPNARVVELPAKVDDLLIGKQISKSELGWAFRWAVKPARV